MLGKAGDTDSVCGEKEILVGGSLMGLPRKIVIIFPYHINGHLYEIVF